MSARPEPAAPGRDPAVARLRATVRTLALDLEEGCRRRCPHRGRDDICHRARPCRNRRLVGPLPLCVQDPRELDA